MLEFFKKTTTNNSILYQFFNQSTTGEIRKIGIGSAIIGDKAVPSLGFELELISNNASILLELLNQFPEENTSEFQISATHIIITVSALKNNKDNYKNLYNFLITNDRFLLPTAEKMLLLTNLRRFANNNFFQETTSSINNNTHVYHKKEVHPIEYRTLINEINEIEKIEQEQAERDEKQRRMSCSEAARRFNPW